MASKLFEQLFAAGDLVGARLLDVQRLDDAVIDPSSITAEKRCMRTPRPFPAVLQMRR